MKKIILLCLTIVASTLAASAQFFPANAKEGATMVFAHKSMGQETTSTSTLKSITKEGSNMTQVVQSEIEMGQTFTFTYSVEIENGFLKSTMEQLLATLKASGMNEADIKVKKNEGGGYPLNPQVGADLPPYNVELSLTLMGMPFTMKMNTTERKVLHKEELTLPAGTFETYVIEEVTVTKMTGMGANEEETSRSIAYFSPEMGVIKSISYSGEKVTSETELKELNI